MVTVFLIRKVCVDGGVREREIAVWVICLCIVVKILSFDSFSSLILCIHTTSSNSLGHFEKLTFGEYSSSLCP